MGPFDRFNDRAKRVLALAQDEATRFNHNYIGTEHLLIGLVREGESAAARVLLSLGAELGKLRSAVEFIIGRGQEVTTPGEITISPRAKKVIELAIDESRKLGHAHVGPEHLLLGLAREGEGIASGVLQSLGATMQQVRHEVLTALARREQPTGGAVVGPDPRGSLTDAEGNKRDWYCEDVLSGKLKVRVIHEDDLVLAFEHPYPEYVVHAVVIPTSHVASLMADEAADPALLAAMIRAVQAVARLVGLHEQGFRIEANAGAPGVTPHLHWHVIGPGLPPRRRQTAAAPLAPPRTGSAVTLEAPLEGPFDRLAGDAKRVLALAQAEAQRMFHNYIGTEHVLPAFVREGTSAAATALTEAGMTLDTARAALEATIGRGDAPARALTLTPRMQGIVDRAKSAVGPGGRVTAGHLLIALIDEGEGIAVRILVAQSDLARIRARTAELLGP